MSVFPTLDFLQIEQRYPKSVKRIQQWLFEQEELKAKTNEFVDPKNPEESKRQFTGMLIQMDPRKLYDVFDSLGFMISISYAVYETENISEGYFTYDVVSPNANERLIETGKIAKNRIEAEQTVFHDAFEYLEKQL